MGAAQPIFLISPGLCISFIMPAIIANIPISPLINRGNAMETYGACMPAPIIEPPALSATRRGNEPGDRWVSFDTRRG